MNPQSGAMPAKRVTSERISQPLWAPQDRPVETPTESNEQQRTASPSPAPRPRRRSHGPRRPDPLAEPATIHPDAGR